MLQSFSRAVQRAHERVRDGRPDAGASMVVVLALSAAVAGLVALTTATGMQALRSSAQHSDFEGALGVAEAGVDATLSTISLAYNGTPSTNFVSTGTCGVPSPTAADVASEASERAWARAQLSALPDSCLQQSSQGQYVAVRPPGRQAVYSMGWYPSRSAPRAKSRVLKAEFLFSPYRPANAILTQGTLDFSGSVAVTAGGGSPANIHTNSSVSGYNASLSVSGALSSSGTLPGSCPSGVTLGCQAGAPLQQMPVVNPRSVYLDQAMANAATWFDLCPGGVMKQPSATGVPCSGTSYPAGQTRGWVYTAGSGSTPDRWTLPRTAGGPFPGTYYVFEADALVGDSGNSSVLWQLTVLAEARRAGITNAATCNKLGGNIDWRLFDMTPQLPGLMLLADANLTGGANNTAGSGLFLARDRISLNTSSATLTGAVVALNECAAQGPNTVQGVTLHYDDTTESPVRDVIRTTLWLEY